MKRSIIVLSLLAVFSVNACRHEKKRDSWRDEHQTVIHDFDSNRSTVEDMEKILIEASEKGSIRVIFPTGEWNYYCNGCAKLPTKEKWATIEFTADDILDKFIGDCIGDWIETNRIKGVHIQIDPSQPAEKFFILEKILRRHGILYWVGSEKDRGRDMIVLRETDGNELATPTDSKVEQGVDGKPPEAPQPPR